jgi:hypothetical protein
MVSSVRPFRFRLTSMTVSVQIPPLRSTAPVETTVPSTMTGDLAMSCSSVGRTMVVA